MTLAEAVQGRQRPKGMIPRVAAQVLWLFHRLFGVSPATNFRAIVSHVILTTPLVYGDKTRLDIANSAVVNNALFNLASGSITIRDNVVFGHNVSLLTGTHEPTAFGDERAAAVPRSGRDIVVDDGAWLATNVTVLGNVRIGVNAVVAAGSVVTRDVPPYTLAAGIPARPVRRLVAGEDEGHDSGT